jgi:hypothetical protein
MPQGSPKAVMSVPGQALATPSERSAGGAVIPRTQSMKSCATGLSARFFSVKSPMACRVEGKSIGKVLTPESRVENRNALAGSIDRK